MMLFIVLLKGFTVIMGIAIAIGMFFYGLDQLTNTEIFHAHHNWFAQLCMWYAGIVATGIGLYAFVALCYAVGSKL